MMMFHEYLLSVSAAVDVTHLRHFADDVAERLPVEIVRHDVVGDAVAPIVQPLAILQL